MKIWTTRLVLLHISLTCLLASSWAYQIFQTKIPNGNRVPHPCIASNTWEGVGHENSIGGGKRNAFGTDFLKAGKEWTEALCNMDSDGDGMSNGQELGDPDCVWSDGQTPERTDNISHPGICTPYGSPECEGQNSFVSCEPEKFDDCPATNKSDVSTLDLRFNSTPIPGQRTTYFCMAFDLPSDQDYHFIAAKPILNNIDIVHHMLLFGCIDEYDKIPVSDQPFECEMAPCPSIIGGWTVGVPGLCFPEGLGFRVGKTSIKRVVLQIHYNNWQESSSYIDSSGLTIYYQPEKPNMKNLVTLWTGQTILKIPPGQERFEQTGTCPSDCTSELLNTPASIIMASNHMHYLGSAMTMELFRDNRLVANITNDEHYSYDSPVLMWHSENPIELRPGDEIKTTCVYNSLSTKQYTYSGSETSDEMCLGFLIMYPVEAFKAVPLCRSDGPVSECDRNLERLSITVTGRSS